MNTSVTFDAADVNYLASNLTEAQLKEELRSHDIWRASKRWCDENDSYAVGKNTFSARMKEKGFVASRGTGNKLIWLGIGLMTDEEKVTLVTSVADFPINSVTRTIQEKDSEKLIKNITEVTSSQSQLGLEDDILDGMRDYPSEHCLACGGSDFWTDFVRKSYIYGACHPKPKGGNGQ